MAKRYIQGIDRIILDHVDIVDFLSRYMQLKRSGKNYKGLCPFHSEKTPSFFVSSDEQLYNCFGCDAGGSVITFVSEMENLGFIDTIEYIADETNLDLKDYMENSEEYSNQYQEKNEILEMNRQGAIFFYRSLQKNNKALKYLKERKIDKNIIKTFGLGYILDEWSLLKDYLLNKGYSIDLIYKAGLVSKSSKGSYYDKFRGRVIFPIFDVKGKIIAFGGRIIEAAEKAPKYLNSPETIVFNKSKTLYGLNIARKYIRTDQKLILVEGYMDVIMLHKYGIKNAVATLGTSFTKEHSRIIRKYVDELIICFDADEAGQKATKRAIENTKGIIQKVKVIQLENGYDPDDFVSEKGYDAFLNEINEAKASHMFLLDDVAKNLDFKEEYDLRDFMIQSREILKDITDYARQHYYCDIIAGKLDMPASRLMKEIFPKTSTSKRNDFKKRKQVKKENSISKDSHLATIEKKLLQFVLMNQEYFYVIQEKINLEYFNLKSVFNIFQFLEDYYEKEDEFKLENSLDYLSIEEGKLCKKLIGENNQGKHDLRDIEIYIKKFEIERLQEELKQLKYSRESTFSAKEKEEIIVKEELVKRELISKKSHLGN